MENFRVKITHDQLIRLGAFNLANKGALHVELTINFQTVQIFNCHLASGTKEIDFKKRVENLS